MQILDATAADVPGIVSIYNDAVTRTAAVWSDRTVDVADRTAWWRTRIDQGYPVLVVREVAPILPAADAVVAYASFADWRAWDGYRHTVEHSIYVREDRRGQGIGHFLLPALVERARTMGKHVMVAGIEGQNVASIRLHLRHGFRRAGHLQEVGTKFGRWLDLTFMQLRLDDRSDPDGLP